MPRHRNGGIRKRCPCSRRNWAKCSHPWHFAFKHGGQHYRLALDRRIGSREAALQEADRLRAKIRAGTFRAPGQPEGPSRDTRLTFGDVADCYLRGYVPADQHGRPRREAGRKLMDWYVRALKRVEIPAAGGTTIRLELKPMADITRADVEAIREAWPRQKACSKGGNVGADRALKRLRHVFNWGIAEGYINATPCRREGVAVVKFAAESPRRRRLDGDEEQRLLQHAPPQLRALIVAALETGCRKGELFALQWQHINLDRRELHLPGEITKTGRSRTIPISKRLLDELEMRKHAPDGTLYEPTAYVFGNELGEGATDIREAWKLTCAAAKITGLRFHDLRREFGSRLMETPRISPHVVRDWLGHADITTTSRYLATTDRTLKEALQGDVPSAVEIQRRLD